MRVVQPKNVIPLLLGVIVIVALLVVKGTSKSISSVSQSGSSWSAHRLLLRHDDKDDENKLDIHRHRVASSSSQSIITQYDILSSEDIYNRLHELADTYPNLATLYNAQDRFGLPAAGTADDCTFDHDPDTDTDTKQEGCKNWILEIQDFITHPPDSSSSNALPEVFLSGALHGDERVGPTTVTEVATLLLQVASCAALPSLSHSTEERIKESVQGQQCRTELQQRGISARHLKWMARLVSTRRIIIVPTANALGYYRNKREEGTIDPNRDFPFDLFKPKLCMRTIAGRTLNEIFRQHMFQLSITFHGGMEAVTYEWGAPSYVNYLSPDDEAQKQLASGYSRYGGGWRGTKPYQTGTMNDVVYYVRGGMEDWAYAGSWDPKRVVQCTPEEFDGYPKEKTIYNNSTLRVFNMLVETSNSKTPPHNDLGTNEDLFRQDTKGNGHISRNIRLSLMAIDMVEPYVSILGVNGVALTDDIIPLSTRSDKLSCMNTKVISVPKSNTEAIIEWTVGGAFTIDATSIVYGRWDDLSDKVNCWNQPNDDDLNGKTWKVSPDSHSLDGTGMFHMDGPNPSPSISLSTTDEEPSTLGPLFATKIDLSKFKAGDQIAIFAKARVDQSWSTVPNKALPPGGPRSHVVNVRTNPDWHHESAGKIIQGRLDWYSIPLTIVIGGAAGVPDDTMELNARYSNVHVVIDTSRKHVTSEGAGIARTYIMGLCLVVLANFVLCVIVCRLRSRWQHQPVPLHEQDLELVEEEGDFEGSVKPYTDFVDEEGDPKGVEMQKYSID